MDTREFGTESGYGLDGMWIVDPLTETEKYTIPVIHHEFGPVLIWSIVCCWHVWATEHRN